MVKNLNYIVVMKDLAGTHAGVCTSTNFYNKKDFDAWYNENVQDGSGRTLKECYEVVYQGTSEEEAQKFLFSAENIAAGFRAAIAESGQAMLGVLNSIENE